MATENILMEAVKRWDRQNLHERIREYILWKQLNHKEHGKDNDLIERIKADQILI